MTRKDEGVLKKSKKTRVLVNIAKQRKFNITRFWIMIGVSIFAIIIVSLGYYFNKEAFYELFVKLVWNNLFDIHTLGQGLLFLLISPYIIFVASFSLSPIYKCETPLNGWMIASYIASLICLLTLIVLTSGKFKKHYRTYGDFDNNILNENDPDKNILYKIVEIDEFLEDNKFKWNIFLHILIYLLSPINIVVGIYSCAWDLHWDNVEYKEDIRKINHRLGRDLPNYKKKD